MPPHWPAKLPSGSLPQATYEVIAIDATSISFVVNRIIKADSSGILDKKSSESCEKATHDLSILHEELGGQGWGELPEVDWARMKQFEFQDLLRQRAVMMDRVVKMGCQLCPDFDQHVSRSELSK